MRHHIVLASTSQRRKALLEQLGLEFTVVASNFQEWLDSARPVEDMAVELARGKALSVAQRFPEAIIIAGDTIVTVQGVQLGKPANVEDARRMLRLNTSATSKVTTSLVVMCHAERYEHVAVNSAYVQFKPYDETLVEAYLATDDWRDKAGAYGIQHPLVRAMLARVEGDEETILGLPTYVLKMQMANFGYKV